MERMDRLSAVIGFFCLAVACVMGFSSDAHAQDQRNYIMTGPEGTVDMGLFNVNTANLPDRGSAFVGSSFIKGEVSVSDYSGNLTIGHSMDVNYPNDLKTKLTLIYSANVSHAYLEDFVGRYNTQSWYFTDANHSLPNYTFLPSRTRENNVNAACWVFGINGIALQTTNFEKNFFLGSEDDPEDEDPEGYYFTGTQVPLLATGYHYTNDLRCPWNSNVERARLMNITDGDANVVATVTDEIRIMSSEGSVITLVNPTSVFNVDFNRSPHDTTTYHLVGKYFDSDEKSNGYAIVQWMGDKFGPRRIWYKPGDGLTYYFEEEYVKYQNLSALFDWGSRQTNPPKIAYLRYIQSQNGDKIDFSYDYQSIFGVDVTHGRKYLKKIRYYNSGGSAVSGTEILFTYVKTNNDYQIHIQNNLSGQSYSIGLVNNNPHNSNSSEGGFDNIVRDNSGACSNIMQVRSITDNNNTNKSVTFMYGNHTRKYTYGAENFDSWNSWERSGFGGPISFDNYYYLEYTTRVMNSREVYHGEKNLFGYWVDTQLDGTTALYDLTKSYNVADASWQFQAGFYKPREYSSNWGYYINTYSSCPNWGYPCYRKYLSQYYWQLYHAGYNYSNMNYAVRDNYTSLMMKTVTNTIYNDQTNSFDPVSQRDYSYSWGHTLYWGSNAPFSASDGEPGNSGSYVSYSNQEYNDLSPRITNIITTITTRNLTSEQSSTVNNTYIETKNYEILKATTKFVTAVYFISQNIYSETRLDAESVYDANNALLHSVTYDYYDIPVAQHRWRNINFQFQLLYYQINSPNDLSLQSKIFNYGSGERARVYDSKTFDVYNYSLNATSISGFNQDICKVRNLTEDISTTSETYRASAQAQSVKTVSNFTSNYGITASTGYSSTNYVYSPDLPIEQITYFRKGTNGTFLRKSRVKNYYSSASDATCGRLIEQVSHGEDDSAPVTTAYYYNTSGNYAGYLNRILYDNGSDVQYKYYGESGVQAAGKLFCDNGSTSTNAIINWSSVLQPQPFRTTRNYDGKSLTTYTAYDGKGNLVFSADENGYYSANCYDGIGRITKQYKPGSFSHYNNYVPPQSGYPDTYGTTAYSYDDNLWTPAVTTTAYRTNSGTNVRTVSKFSPSQLAYETYAVNGSPILKSKEKVNYLGKKWYSEDGDGYNAYYYYDSYLNLSQTRFNGNNTDAPNKRQIVDYDGGPNYFKRVQLVDENGNIEYNQYDLFGNIIANQKRLGSRYLTTAFSYDNLGRLQTVTTPENKVTTYAYDTRGNISTRISPNSGTTSYLYDKYHNLRFIKDANHIGKSWDFIYNKYDALNRLVETGEVPSASPSYFTQTNADNGQLSIAGSKCSKQLIYDNVMYSDQRNVKGKPSYVISWNLGYPVTASYSYDEMGRVEWIRYDLGYAGRQLPIQINYWYDYQGNIIKKCFADKADIGNTLYTFYNYDEEGRLSTVSTSQDATGASSERNAKYSYFESNRVRQLTLGSMPAQVIDYTYNDRGWLKSINDPENMGTNKFAMTLGYNVRDKIATVFPFTPQNNGNVSWLVYRMAGISNTYNSPYYGQVSTDYIGRVFTYDGMNRLTQAPFGYHYGSYWFNNASNWSASYSYTDDGNFNTLNRYDNNGNMVDQLTYNYSSGTDKLNSITNAVGIGSSYSYDANGNVNSDSRNGMTFAGYSIQNLPQQLIVDGRVFNYWYDANGNRIRKQGGGTDELYILGKDGETEAVFDTYGMLKFWNILAGTESIGRIEKK